MADTSPFEIMAGIFEAYIAPVGEAYPAINVAPAGNWVQLGTNRSRNMGEEGVRILHNQTQTLFHVLGTTVPVKAFRTQEGLSVSFVLHDLTLEHYARVMDGATVTDVAAGAGVAGYRHFSFLRGQEVQERAVLVRGDKSPYADTFNTQFELYQCVQEGEPELVFDKGTPAGIRFTFRALYNNSNSNIGRIVAQDAAPV